MSALPLCSACPPQHNQGRIARESIPPFLEQKGQSMRFNRLHGCLVAAALLAGTSTAFAQDEKTDEKTGENTDEKTDDKAAPTQVAQNEPAPPPPPSADQPTSSGPTTPGARMMSEAEVRKMVEEQVAKMRPKGPSVEFSGYARAGVGLNIRGGKEVCFVLNGADAK